MFKKLYGDGIHDDTDAIQEMIDSGCCEVVLPVLAAENPMGGSDVSDVSGNVRLCDAGLPLGTIVRLYDADGFFALAELREFEDGAAFKPVKQYRV